MGTTATRSFAKKRVRRRSLLGVVAELITSSSSATTGKRALPANTKPKTREGERFGLMALQTWQEVTHLGGPLAPQRERCLQMKSVPFQEAFSLVRSW